MFNCLKTSIQTRKSRQSQVFLRPQQLILYLTSLSLNASSLRATFSHLRAREKREVSKPHAAAEDTIKTHKKDLNSGSSAFNIWLSLQSAGRTSTFQDQGGAINLYGNIKPEVTKETSHTDVCKVQSFSLISAYGSCRYLSTSTVC